MRVWIVCPCFFDTASFSRVREEATAVLRAVVPDAQLTFVLVDDSAGQDPDVAGMATLRDVQIVTPPYNLGHQGALVFALRGLGRALEQDDYVVTMDADGEDRPEDLGRLLAPLLATRDNLHKVSLAHRTHRAESATFKVLYSAFKLVFVALTGTVIRSGNFVAYRGWLLKQVIYHPHFDHCYASSFVSLPMQTELVPLPRGSRYAGQSRMGYMGLFTHGVRMLMPFSERIATRGILASSVLLGVSALTLAVALALRCDPRWALAGVFYATLTLGIFVLLFATFSQSKARSLRGLKD
jgi:hypothetical protein